MTSEERRERRYKRRREKRDRRKRERLKDADSFEKVFTFTHLYDTYKKCRNGCSWKASVQRFNAMAPLLVNRLYNKLHNGSYKSGAMRSFTVRERGRERRIQACSMGDNIVQRCLTDYALIPAFHSGFIYDNAASQTGKGYRFAVERMEKHLRRHVRRHGKEGYILLFDFSKFFDNLSHKVIRWELGRRFTDRRMLGITMHFVNKYGDTGMGIGSPISQTLALSMPNRLDHYVKEVLRIKGYGRYMDDGYLIHESKAYLQKCLSVIRRICTAYGIMLNPKKTRIVKLSHGFVFLKNKVCVTDSGKIIRTMPRDSITRMRRKLKKMARLLEKGSLKYSDVYDSFQSWLQYARFFRSWHTRQKMSDLFHNLFITPWLAHGAV